MRKHIASLSKALFSDGETFIPVARSMSITVSVFLSAALFGDYIYTSKFLLGGSGQQIFPAFAAFGSRSTNFSVHLFIFLQL